MSGDAAIGHKAEGEYTYCGDCWQWMPNAEWPVHFRQPNHREQVRHRAARLRAYDARDAYLEAQRRADAEREPYWGV